MGVFTRFRDIISANLNAMLDKAEDPEKMIKLMIQEMEDTLVEIKASCAGVMAQRKRTGRAFEEAQAHADKWARKAALAVDKGREDLAREALLEKRRFNEQATALENEAAECEALVEQYQSEILQLEEKLRTAKEKQRILVQRHIHARKKRRAEGEIRRFDSADAMLRFDKFESRVERMEAEAGLINYGRKSGGESLEDRFADLEGDEEIEKELAALRRDRATAEPKGRSAD
jgi:phage shock protein A